jgi:hypothetical protein
MRLKPEIRKLLDSPQLSTPQNALHGESTRPYSSVRTDNYTSDQRKPDGWLVFHAAAGQKGQLGGGDSSSELCA